MADETETELHLVITAVVGADSAATAGAACQHLARRVDGEVTTVTDCSDEDPGCWAVTITRGAGTAAGTAAGDDAAGASLSSAVRRLLRELGLPHRHSRIFCAPPIAWTVLEHPDSVGDLVADGERLLVEARCATSTPS